MTKREKMDYLKNYTANRMELTRLQEEMAQIRSEAERVTGRLSAAGAGRGGSGDRLQLAVERLEELRGKLAEGYLRRVKLREEIEAAIQSVPGEQLRLLLRYRYINGWTWERISQAFCYDPDGRNVYKLHGKALGLLNPDIVLHGQSLVSLE